MRRLAGLPAFSLVGLPDKAVSEARERVRAALTALSIALPSKRITINLSPADLPKEGSHFDLPIALALLAALDILPKEEVEGPSRWASCRSTARWSRSIGALPAAMAAAEEERRCLPARLRRRGRLGRRGRGHRARLARRGDPPLHRPGRAPGRAGRGPRPPEPPARPAPTCKGRNAPSARSRSRRPGGTTS
jgi:magnesium chelatase family protein